MSVGTSGSVTRCAALTLSAAHHLERPRQAAAERERKRQHIVELVELGHPPCADQALRATSRHVSSRLLGTTIAGRQLSCSARTLLAGVGSSRAGCAAEGESHVVWVERMHGEREATARGRGCLSPDRESQACRLQLAPAEVVS